MDIEKVLINLYDQIEMVYNELRVEVESVYRKNNLIFQESDALRTSKGDIYAKVFGNFLAKTTNLSISFEVSPKGTRKRIDILLGEKFAIEVKKSGIYSKPELILKQWNEKKQAIPQYYHLFVSFDEIMTYNTILRELMKDEYFIFRQHRPKPAVYFPDELKRLLDFIKITK